jgi:hypothetical protein
MISSCVENNELFRKVENKKKSNAQETVTMGDIRE